LTVEIVDENSATCEPRYLTLNPEPGVWEIDWTTDHIKALRFAQRDDADAFACAFLDGNGHIAEHGWGYLDSEKF